MRNLSNSAAVNRELTAMQVSHTKEGTRIEKGTLYFLGYLTALIIVIGILYSTGLIIE